MSASQNHRLPVSPVPRMRKQEPKIERLFYAKVAIMEIADIRNGKTPLPVIRKRRCRRLEPASHRTQHLSDTPADSKLAISLRKFTAASTNG